MDIEEEIALTRGRLEKAKRIADAAILNRKMLASTLRHLLRMQSLDSARVKATNSTDRALEVLSRHRNGETYRSIGESLGLSASRTANISKRGERIERWRAANPTPPKA